MAKNVGIGIQDFEKVITRGCFYVDKTHFIREWWDSNDEVTLITRPRRFGKTLTMSMLDYFFSVRHAGSALFERLSVWKEQRFRELQGTYPVISLTFANVKGNSFEKTRRMINEILAELYERNAFLRESGLLGEKELQYYGRVCAEMDETTAVLAIHRMSDFLSRFYGKKTIIILDEYDTPMQEAYVNGFWDETVSYMRSMLNASFKTNPHLERGILTGITRAGKESIFSDLNNLEVVTTTSNKYTDVFGFTEEEVFAAMDEMGYTEKEEVREWYDGFTFGATADIYNPWSILNFLDTGRFDTYWANTSSNSLVGRLVREGSRKVKQNFELLLNGECITAELDEQVVYNQLEGKQNAIWSFLLAAGYLKVVSYDDSVMRRGGGKASYRLALTNMEVRLMFGDMISGWFTDYAEDDYTDFIQALLQDDRKLMNIYMNRVLLATASYFDGGSRPSGSEPERFYHGLVLGILVELYGRYAVSSNRESGYGRYDIMLEPRRRGETAMIMEFKVHDPESERTLEDTAEAALRQIEEKHYAQTLKDRGIAPENIRMYGFAFEGKRVLIL